MRRIKRVLNRTLSNFGVVVKQVNKLPEHHLFGLRQMNIRTILDIGANEGQFASMMREIFPNALIISFEPVPAAFARLVLSAKGDSRWRVENLALGPSDGVCPMNLHSNHTSSSSFLPSTEHEGKLYPETRDQQVVELPMQRLDRWVAAEDMTLDHPLMVKLDVQGFELSVLEGGSHVFSIADVVLIEVIVQPLYHGQASFEQLVVKLGAFGLTFQGVIEHGVDDRNRVVSLDALFFR